jgi:hypothetical protein
MSGKLKDVVAITGKYKNKSGEDKASYTNCGSIIESGGKQYLILEVIPAPVIGKDGIAKWFLNLYDPKPKEEARPVPKAVGQDFNDEIPF